MSTKREKEKQPIQVFVRTRPLNQQEKVGRSLTCVDVLGGKEISIRHAHGKKYTFDHVFGPNTKQLDVYRTVVGPFIHEVLAGYNCTVFAYGQTGTGKTYTMAGGTDTDDSISWQDDESAGIIPRALSHLFEELMLLQQEYTVRVTYLELYNEEIYDLLSETDDPARIKLFEDRSQKGSVIIQGLEQVTVVNKNQVYKILEKGQEKRRTASTLMNSQSSRSHTVFSITIHTREMTVDGEFVVKTGKLNLVDLAGSENISRSGAVDKRAREAGSINQSLLTLGRVIKALVERTGHIPYRESKLTRILQDSLGGRTKTSIIATISPASCNLEETLSTLDYAHRARNITNRPEINQRMSQQALMNQYAEEIKKMQKDLAATRTGTGVYLAQENYEQLIADHQYSKEELAEKITAVRELETQLAELEEQKANHLRQWIELKESFEESEKERSLQKYLAENYKAKTYKYHSQAQTLLNIAKENYENCKKINCRVGETHFELINNVKKYKNDTDKSMNVMKSVLEELKNKQRETDRKKDAFINQLLNTFTNLVIRKEDSYCENSEEIKKWANQLENSFKLEINTFKEEWCTINADTINNSEKIFDTIHNKQVNVYNSLSQQLQHLQIVYNNSFANVQQQMNKINAAFFLEVTKLSETILEQQNLHELQKQGFAKTQNLLADVQKAIHCLNAETKCIEDRMFTSNELLSFSLDSLSNLTSNMQDSFDNVSSDVTKTAQETEKEFSTLIAQNDEYKMCQDQQKDANAEVVLNLKHSNDHVNQFLNETLLQSVNDASQYLINSCTDHLKKVADVVQISDKYSEHCDNVSKELRSGIETIINETATTEDNRIQLENKLTGDLTQCQEKLSVFTGLSKNTTNYNTPTKLNMAFPEIKNLTPKEQILRRYNDENTDPSDV